MSFSKIDICNISLAALGAGAIRSFDENNKRARMADVFFEPARDFVLARFDWPFARKYASLNEVVLTSHVPTGQYSYALPPDCLASRDILPEGSSDWWIIMGSALYAKKPGVILKYTSKVTTVSLFSFTFSMTVATKLAVLMSPAITQDKKLTAALQIEYVNTSAEAMEADANIGNDYRAYDENPDNDSFVNPDGPTEHLEFLTGDPAA